MAIYMDGSICMSNSGLIFAISSSFLHPFGLHTQFIDVDTFLFQLGRGKLKDLGTSHLSGSDSHCESSVDLVSLVLHLDVGLLEQGA